MKRRNVRRHTALAAVVALSCIVWNYTGTAYAAETEFVPAEITAMNDTEMSFEMEALTVEAKRPDWESKLSPGTVTVVRPDDYKGEQKTLSELLLMVPGVHVRDVNGKGQYTTVTVRGSTAAQVGVFIDGVLSNLGGDSAADLSAIPVANVERIEVYRGYIPSRFAGTYIGGVINIVTKKPEKENISLELGKSSYGGRKGAMEITAPLGDGSLMFGLNYESSDGDFRYDNYAARANVDTIQNSIVGYESIIANDDIENMNAYGYTGGVDQWVDYVNSGGFLNDYKANLNSMSFDMFISTIGEPALKEYYGEDFYLAARDDWEANGKMLGKDKNIFINEYASNVNASVKPGDNPDVNAAKKMLAEEKKKLKNAKNAKRWRKYNDYENVNSIIKWQNDNWMVKGSWNKIDRHLPDSLWLGSMPSNAKPGHIVDVYDAYRYDSRRQKIDTKELLLQNRNTVGDLEWGWMLDYTKTEKTYRAEHITDEDIWDSAPFREWSKYDSDKYNAQVDGTYKLSDNNMLDFQINYSHEQMDLDGDGLDKALEDESSIYAQTRNKYEQDILNIQLQDTITLDDKDTWYLTPSVKYNRSTITGYSDGHRFKEGDIYNFTWISPKDEQTDSKVTWQLALKKEFNENFTMRMTGGTYYRLLNMYEIAGDGAGILPAPNTNGYRESSFPVPEEGKQFDVSAIWNGSALGADNKTTLTYFWRDSDNMLQLQRFGKDYWCYMNDVKGTVNGVELQTNFNWNKFDLDMQITYMKTDAQKRNSALVGGYDYIDVWQTYQPEWEGNVRLTYRPTDVFSVFAEAHYTGDYYTYNAPKDGNAQYNSSTAGGAVDNLFVFNTGVKYKFCDDWQITLGCNDVFNKGPKQMILTDTPNGPMLVNTEFPIQGRTYYVTVKHEF